MDKKSFFKNALYTALFVSGLGFVALKLYWFSLIWWFDMPMHFLGGYMLGLAFFYFVWPRELDVLAVVKIMIGVLVVGIGWEVFELIFVNVVAQNPFLTLDSLSDVCFDIAGGLAAIFFSFSKITKFSETTV